MLADKALIVSLKISQYTGRKLDKAATNSVEVEYKTERQVGNYNKKLLPGARELADIHALSARIRQFTYEQTLPWYSDGSRILSSKNYIDFTRRFSSMRDEFNTAVRQFVQEYPRLVQDARHKLGNLFKEAEYPLPAQIADSFSCDIDFMPMPDVTDFRVEILDSEKDAFLSKMANVERDARRECYRRLYDVVSKAVTALSKPDAKFKNTLIENIQDLCTLMPKLDVTQDATLDALRKDLDKVIAGISIDSCRANPVSRNDAAEKLAEATKRLSACMGAL